MGIIGQLTVFLFFFFLFFLWILFLRKKLLKMWNDVSQQEIHFYRQMERVVKEFYDHREEICLADNQECFKILKRFRKKKIRSLLLSKRQELFNALTVIYDEIKENNNQKLKNVQLEFEKLQKIRRIYNSRVLVYNQTINVFPTRYVALKLNLKTKEYFG
jgi:hypothetical protein